MIFYNYLNMIRRHPSGFLLAVVIGVGTTVYTLHPLLDKHSEKHRRWMKALEDERKRRDAGKGNTLKADTNGLNYLNETAVNRSREPVHPEQTPVIDSKEP